MRIDLSGKVALITDVDSGIGVVSAEAFLDAGASVVFSGKNYDEMKEQADRLAAKGKTLVLQCDFSNEDGIKRMVEKAVAEFGQIDAVYNNVDWMSPYVEIEKVSAVDVIRTYDENLKRVLLCMKYQAKQMLKQGGGTIVNCASMGSINDVVGRTGFPAPKHGIAGITQSAAMEYASRGIRINAVCPGMIDMPIFSARLTRNANLLDAMIDQVPVKRLGSADEIAQAILWLSSQASSFVVGHSLIVDGGITMRV